MDKGSKKSIGIPLDLSRLFANVYNTIVRKSLFFLAGKSSNYVGFEGHAGVFGNNRAFGLKKKKDRPRYIAEGLEISLSLCDDQICLHKPLPEFITAVIQKGARDIGTVTSPLIPMSITFPAMAIPAAVIKGSSKASISDFSSPKIRMAMTGGDWPMSISTAMIALHVKSVHEHPRQQSPFALFQVTDGPGRGYNLKKLS